MVCSWESHHVSRSREGAGSVGVGIEEEEDREEEVIKICWGRKKGPKFSSK